jgi:hypothetical protein
VAPGPRGDPSALRWTQPQEPAVCLVITLTALNKLVRAVMRTRGASGSARYERDIEIATPNRSGGTFHPLADQSFEMVGCAHTCVNTGCSSRSLLSESIHFQPAGPTSRCSPWLSSSTGLLTTEPVAPSRADIALGNRVSKSRIVTLFGVMAILAHVIRSTCREVGHPRLPPFWPKVTPAGHGILGHHFVRPLDLGRPTNQ